jgi:hypothetical protein
MLDLAFKKTAGGKFIDRNSTGAGGFEFAERLWKSFTFLDNGAHFSDASARLDVYSWVKFVVKLRPPSQRESLTPSGAAPRSYKTNSVYPKFTRLLPPWEIPYT